MPMEPFKHVQQNVTPQIEKAELTLYNGESDLSAGCYVIFLRPGIFGNKDPIGSSCIKAPVFQISININPQNTPPRIIVLLGDTESDSKDSLTFNMPGDLNIHQPHEVRVDWKQNKITSLEIDGVGFGLFSLSPLTA